MLQWMGGSRRKVTASRNSVHKRQKQYFEQRKRQQQTSGFDCYSDGKPSCTQHCENSKSLDILSLENVTSAAQQPVDCQFIVRDDDDDHEDLNLHRQYSYNPPACQTDREIVVNQSEQSEERASLSFHPQSVYSTKVLTSVCYPNEDLVPNGPKSSNLMLSSAQQLSIIDLLGDSGTNNNTEDMSVRTQEAHVAFSIEGLGKVKPETPVQSPKLPCRKTHRTQVSTKHLEYGFDDLVFPMELMIQDDDFSPEGSSIDFSLSSTNTVNLTRNSDHKFLRFRNSSLSNWNDSNFEDVFGYNKLSPSTQERPRNIWTGDNIFDDIGEFGSFGTNCMDRRDVGYYDGSSNCKNHWKRDFDFEDWNLPGKNVQVQ